MSKITFQMENNLSAVDPMVVEIENSMLADVSISDQLRCTLCLSEVLTNLVLHAQTLEKAEPIRIIIAKNVKKIEIEIFDPIGVTSFNPIERATALKDVDVMSESGRGLGLIIECCDAIDYNAVGQRTRLKLTFNL